MIEGIDISNCQKLVNWDKVVNEGNKKFVFIKACDSYNKKLFVDSSFKSHSEGSKSVGLPRGGYCFFHPATPPRDQARLLIDTTGDLELKPVIDFECLDNLYTIKVIGGQNVHIPIPQVLDAAEEFIAEAVSYGRRDVIIYTGKSFYDMALMGANKTYSPLSNYQLWHAQYKSNANSAPDISTAWDKWTLYQYRGDAFPEFNIPAGRCPGIDVNCDLDKFNGDAAEFAAWVAGCAIPPVPQGIWAQRPIEIPTIEQVLDENAAFMGKIWKE